MIRRFNIVTAFAALKAEATAQADRWPVWTPVAFGIGAASYFGLAREPPLWPALVLTAIGAGLAVSAKAWGRSRGLAVASALLAFLAAGFATADLKASLLAAPRIPAGLGVAQVEGWVVDVASPSADKGRLLIAPMWIGHLAARNTPALVRVVVGRDFVVGPGKAVRMTALLDPPPGPAAPGGFDFARDAWFERLGGVGIALKPPMLTALPRPSPLLRLQMTLNGARWRLARRLDADLRRTAPMAGDDAAGLAVAVTTSHEGALSSGAEDDLRGSGLAHMLAIAGLHTAAVSGFVFAVLRLGVAAWPWLALRLSGKKLAAGGGLIAVLIYLALSGAHPPARRAAVTASVAFIAILLDRRAISMRSLSMAALIVLVLQPEAVVQPGFQMSFSATGALVAMAELWPRHRRSISAPWPIAFLQRAKDWTLALIAVSVVAGAATAPFAIQHFNRMTNYGVFANLSADFVASAVMMPALALAGAGELMGVSQGVLTPPLTIAAFAARAILAIAHVCAHAPHASLNAPSAPPIAMLLAFLGIVFACLWRGRLRWIGALLACAVLVWPRPAPPSAWIAADGDDAAVVVKGAMVTMKPGKRAYATGLWSARRGLLTPADPTAARDALFDCDRYSCRPKPSVRPSVSLWWGRRAPTDQDADALCRAAEIVVLRPLDGPPPACARRIVITGQDIAVGGSAELYAPTGASGWRIRWANPIRGLRPWSGPSAAEAAVSDNGG